MADTTSYKLSGTAVAKLAEMWRASQRDNPGLGGGPIPRGRAGDHWFYGKVTDGGPKDYTVSRQFLSGDGTFVDAAGDYAQSVSATNLADYDATEPVLQNGDYVIVRWDYDSDGTARYVIDGVALDPVWQTVVTGFGDNGTDKVTYDTIEILVLKTRNPTPNQTLLTYGDCTTGS